MALPTADSIASERAEVVRHFRRNYAAHSLEGGLFIGGVALVHPQTIAPRLIERLGGPDWAIAAAPVLLMLGFFIPSLFITHRLERLRFLKPFIMWLGVAQRLPYLLVGLSLLFLPQADHWTLALVVLAPLLSGLAGGISITAWREYVAKSIPAEKRASLWALRFVLGGLLGVVAGQIVERVLGHHSEIRAYGLLHLGVFLCMMGSYAVFALTREPNLTSARPSAERNWWGYTRSMRRIIGNDAHLPAYLGCRALYSGLFVVLPFLTLRALEVLHAGDGYLGRLLMFQMLGSVLGNLAGGVLGDRGGGRSVLILSQAGSVVVAAASPALHSPLAFEALFFALGLAVGLGSVGVATLDLEMSGFDQRMSYQTVIGLSHLLGMVGAVALATTVRRLTPNFAVLAWIAAGLMLGSLLLLSRLPEPRRRLARPTHST